MTRKVCAAVTLVVAWAGSAAANPALDEGRRLFLGTLPLAGHMVGHANPLPSEASRCRNCHDAPGLPASTGKRFGPRLDARHLLEPHARRGGPPSRYGAASLCRALREGIDPAGVILTAAMPRYRIDDADCRRLWTLLTSDM